MKIIKLALRSLQYFRVYSAINILGLALGLCCVIIIARYLYGQLTIDHFKKNNRIFVVTEENSKDNKKSISGIYTRVKYPNITDHPNIDMYSVIYFELKGDNYIKIDGISHGVSILFSDSLFFKISDYPLIGGSIDLPNISSVLITNEFSEKVFGKRNPIGETINYDNTIFTITGVLGKINSSLNFDIVLSNKLKNLPYKSTTLVLLNPNTDYKTINSEYNVFFNIPNFLEFNIRNQLMPLDKLFFRNHITSTIFSSEGNRNHIVLLAFIGILLLFVSLVNFISIYTLVVMKRVKEFGVKKVFGANGSNIFFQICIENICMITLSLFLSLVFIELLSPLVCNIVGLDQYPYQIFDFVFFIGLLSLLPICTCIYPYYKYTYSAPINSLQSSTKGGLLSNKYLLTFKYVVTIVLIIVTSFFLKQLYFLLHIDPGIEIKNIIKVRFSVEGKRFNNADEWVVWASKLMDNEEKIKVELNECPYIDKWTFGVNPIKYHLSTKIKTNKREENEFIDIETDEKWLEVFKIRAIQGRLWDPEKDKNNYNIIVSQEVLSKLGILDFTKETLESDEWNQINFDNQNIPILKKDPPYTIIGVIENINTGHFALAHLPVILRYRNQGNNSPVLASIVPGHTKDAIEFLQKLHNETVGGEFEYSFIEDDVRDLYTEDKKVAIIYSAFTLVAILISALGLFGMSLYDIQLRYKEIAIRKINGANVKDILRLLLIKYLKLLILAFVIATPLAWFAVYKYSENFARKTNLSWWIFALAFVVTAGISLLTLIYQTQKAANTNPSEVVRMEN